MKKKQYSRSITDDWEVSQDAAPKVKKKVKSQPIKPSACLSLPPSRTVKRGILHKKAFGIYHWDTFDNETLLIGEAQTLEAAKAFVQTRYAGRIGPDGADQVDIVDRSGNVVEKVSVR